MTNLDNDVTDSCLVGYSGWIVLTSKKQFVNCQLSSTSTEIFDWESIVQHDCWLQS